jgi:hypothetical protein
MIIKDPTSAEVVGTTVGCSTYVAIGAATGGPVGAAVGAGIYVGSRIIGGLISKVFF